MTETTKHILSFDVEEYFQVEALRERLDSDDSTSWPSRVDWQLDRVLTLLAAAGTRATFFVLGTVAASHPEAIKRIAQAGHEIASHGMSHEMLTRLSPKAFAGELKESRAILQDLTGQSVLGFRAPTFSLLQETAWALDVLQEAGFGYDSSIFPVHHDRYGIPGAPRWIHRAVGPQGGEGILEIPPSTLQCWRWILPAGGGGYLRLLPACWIRWALGQAQKAGVPGMVYLHPWELDPHQPPLPLGRVGSWRHRVNLARTAGKLAYLLRHGNFAPAGEVLASIDAASLEHHTYGRAETVV